MQRSNIYLWYIYIFKKPNIDKYTDEIKCRRCRNSLNICRFRHWSIVSISRPTMDYSAVIDYYINVHQAARTHTWVVRNQFFKLSGCFYRGCIYEVREVKAFSRKYARNERSLIKFQRLSRLFYRDNYPDVYVYIYVYVCLSSSCHNPAQYSCTYHRIMWRIRAQASDSDTLRLGVRISSCGGLSSWKLHTRYPGISRRYVKYYTSKRDSGDAVFEWTCTRTRAARLRGFPSFRCGLAQFGLAELKPF